MLTDEPCTIEGRRVGIANGSSVPSSPKPSFSFCSSSSVECRFASGGSRTSPVSAQANLTGRSRCLHAFIKCTFSTAAIISDGTPVVYGGTFPY